MPGTPSASRLAIVVVTLSTLVSGTGCGVRRDNFQSWDLPRLRSHLESRPGDAEARRWYGRRLIESGNVSGGFDELAKASDAEPDDAGIRADAVLASYRAHGISAADAVAAEFLARHPGEPLVIQSRAQAYEEEGLKPPMDAMRFQQLAKATHLDPERTPAWRAMAVVLDDNGFHRGARRCLEASVAANPLDVESWHHLGRLCSADDIAASVDAFQRAVQVSPDEPVLRLDLASVLTSANRAEEADAQFVKALESAKGDPIVLRAVAGHFATNPVRQAMAEQLLEELLGKNPADREARSILGRLRLEQGRFEEAKSHLEKAVSGPLDDASESLYALSRCRARNGDKRGAAALATAARRHKEERFAHARLIELAFRSPSDARLRLAVARSHAKRRETLRALSQFRAAVALAPRNASVRKEAMAYEASLPAPLVARETALFEALVTFEREGN